MLLGLVQIVAPSRLHFGLFSFNRPGVRAFGGLGVMIDQPGVLVTARRASDWKFTGDLSDRCARFAHRWAESNHGAAPAAIETHSAPDHVGLGTGTQLGLATTAALEALAGHAARWSAGRVPPEVAVELAHKAGRGQRSAVGVHGFALGGLIIEGGKLVTPGSPLQISPLTAHVALPAAWRFVLVRPVTGTGLAGESERTAFEQLPPTSPALSSKLESIALTEVLPAAQRQDYAAFATALEEFGTLAGECFAPVQGGLFASPQVAEVARRMRAAGSQGVAQSSWGPTVAAVTPDLPTAEALATRLRAESDVTVQIAAPSAAGARWQGE